MTVALRIRDLVMEYRSRRGDVRALDGADLDVASGEVLGIVGESGSGKSTLAAAIGRLPLPGIRHVSGEIMLAGRPLFQLSAAELRTLRRAELGFVFQDPIGTLDPTMKVGTQLAAVLAGDTSGRSVESRLAEVELADVGRVARSYPHELSGGMAQRVAIAMAIANRPKIIVADEPTAALDASIKSHILDLLVSQCRQLGATLLLFSHDLYAIRRSSDRVAVMYGGRVVEAGNTPNVLDRPLHPYTMALLGSAVGHERPGGQVNPIAGAPLALHARLEACPFAPRCIIAIAQCTCVRPEARILENRHVVCHRAHEALALRSAL
jgi:oligopeptide/dipeptide ABC transporter ATP-binding protein